MLPPLPVRMPSSLSSSKKRSSSSSSSENAAALGAAATAFFQGAGIGASMMLFGAISDALARARSRRRLRKLQKQAWAPPLSYPLLRKAAVAMTEASTSSISMQSAEELDRCYPAPARRPTQGERAAAAAAAAAAVLAHAPAAARARVAPRWFAGAYAGCEASVSVVSSSRRSSKSVTISTGKEEAAVSEKNRKPASVAAAKPTTTPAAKAPTATAKRPASASSSRRRTRPASARSQRRPVSSSSGKR